MIITQRARIKHAHFLCARNRFRRWFPMREHPKKGGYTHTRQNVFFPIISILNKRARTRNCMVLTHFLSVCWCRHLMLWILLVEVDWSCCIHKNFTTTDDTQECYLDGGLRSMMLTQHIYIIVNTDAQREFFTLAVCCRDDHQFEKVERRQHISCCQQNTSSPSSLTVNLLTQFRRLKWMIERDDNDHFSTYTCECAYV